MATGTNGIATRGEINGKCKGVFHSDSTRCPTLSELNSSYCLSISGSYSSNQLVKYSDIGIKSKTITFILTENITGDASTDYVEVLVGSNSTDGTKNTTSIGKVSIGNTSGTGGKSVSVSCDLSSLSLGSSQYYVTFKCGELGSQREWRFRTNLDGNWVDNDRSGKTFYSKPYPLQATSSTSQSVLGGYENPPITTVYLHIYNS